MGFNTVAFVLNDFSHTLEKSPKTTAWLLAHPPMSESEKNKEYYHGRPMEGEPPVHFQALEVLPTFHADMQKFFYAGGNQITELKPLRLGLTKEGKKTLTLELPEWFENRFIGVSTPKKWRAAPKYEGIRSGRFSSKNPNLSNLPKTKGK